MEQQRPAQIQIMRNAILSIDRNGLMWITEFRHPYLNRAMEIFSRLGDWDIWTGSIATLLLTPKTVNPVLRPLGFKILPRILGALSICFTLKRIARRSRPSLSVEGFSTLLSDPDPYSFPSSHSACSWAACISAARHLGGLGWLLVFHAVLISYSRIHVGAHYPLDVLIGAGVGTTIGLL